MSHILSVSQLNKYISSIIKNDNTLSDVTVSGEISNFKNHSSGHLYFTLKDEKTVIRCVMFRSQAATLNFRPVDGNKVLVKGYVSIYEKSGSYQIYVSNISLKGEGDLYLKFEKMKNALREKGYFDDANKKIIPYLPSTIGVITSSTGAVVNDIINVLDRRFDGYNLLLYPSRVQGSGAHLEIAEGIRYFNEKKNVDVIILARGGGSIEDLWPFNELLLAKAIYQSVIPVISAVGHETDFTIADFVSDLRAPTPSAAAELVLPIKSEIIQFIEERSVRINQAYENLINKKKMELTELTNRPVLKRPDEFLNIMQMNLDYMTEKIVHAGNNVVNIHEKNFQILTNKLEALSPLATLNRGFAIVSDQQNNIVTSIKNIKKEQIINTKLGDGNIISKVISREECNE